MDDFALEVAREARALRLNALNLENADPQKLQTFARQVLEGLAARGLVAGEEQIGCHAAPRWSGH
ncbi:hypothetical protein [Deinococcus navajonensis]|uniref:Uncharacterized protein n=1 Tax=Deinococcus navajonensis TaxID=309884 RepID=A0ABV8XNT7_9DEIO